MYTSDQITVVLLAAGDSSRLWPFSDKHMISFFGKPLISYSIEQLIRFGFKQFIILSNDSNKVDFEKIIGNYENVSIQIIIQKNKNGMAGAVLDAKEHISKKPILIVGPSDIYEDTLVNQFLEKLKNNPQALLTGTYSDQYFPGGYLTISNDLITSIVEKPDPQKTPSNIVNFVFDYFANSDQFIEVLGSIKTASDDMYERAIQQLISIGVKFTFLPYKGYWGYVKYPWHIQNLTMHFLSQLKGRRGKNVIVDPSANIDDTVILEDNVRVFENARVVGPAYIGKGSVIGNNVLVRESVIGENCMVGFSCEIARSYIGNNCWFHNNYIGDSVISNNVHMGAGAVTANFRLDEQAISSKIGLKKENTGKTKMGAVIGSYSRIGVHATLMPGIKIGKRSFISSATLVDEDIPDSIFYKMVSTKYKKVKNKMYTK